MSCIGILNHKLQLKTKYKNYILAVYRNKHLSNALAKSFPMKVNSFLTLPIGSTAF